MVAVAGHHARATREPGRLVARVVAQAGVVGVALDVRFVDHVQAELVAQVEEPRVVRVVRRAHGGDVVTPHRQQIGAHVVDGDGTAAGGVVVVAVDAEDPHRLPVDEQLAVAHLHVAESDLHVATIDDDPAAQEARLDAIAVRVLGRPRTRLRDVEGERHAVTREHVRLGEGVRHRAALHAPDALAVRREQGCLDDAARLRRAGEADVGVDGERARARASRSSDAAQRTSASRTSERDSRCTSRCSPAIHHWSWSST